MKPHTLWNLRVRELHRIANNGSVGPSMTLVHNVLEVACDSGYGVPHWNDEATRTQEEVLVLLDKAIEISKEPKLEPVS